MKFAISHLYSEPGISFQISYKIDEYIEDKITENIMIPYGLDKNRKDTFLNLIVSTNSKTVELEVKGPDYDKESDFITWGLWLPYKNISKAEDQLPPYLKYLFDAIVLVLKNYNVNEEDIRKVQKDIENEVINNSEYLFDEEFIPPPDLSSYINT